MYKKSNLDNILKNEGYYEIKEIDGKGTCGLFRFMFTTGLVIGIDEIGYEGRYCYSTEREAIDAINSWKGLGDPPGLWIKYKGRTGERSNPNFSNGCENCIKK